MSRPKGRLSRAEQAAKLLPKDMNVPTTEGFSSMFFVVNGGELRIDNAGPFSPDVVRRRILPWLKRAYGVKA